MNIQILSSSATSEGVWTEIDPLISPFSVSVFGFASGDTVEIYVTNNYSVPSPAVAPVSGDGTMQLGMDITNDTMVNVIGNYRWLRVRKSTAGGSPATTQAILQGLTQTV